MKKSQSTSRDTELQHFIRMLEKQVENLPHKIDQIQGRRGIIGMKKELNIDFCLGKNVKKKKKIKKSFLYIDLDKEK